MGQDLILRLPHMADCRILRGNVRRAGWGDNYEIYELSVNVEAYSN